MVARISVKSDIDQVIGRLSKAAPRAVEIASQRALLLATLEEAGPDQGQRRVA